MRSDADRQVGSQADQLASTSKVREVSQGLDNRCLDAPYTFARHPWPQRRYRQIAAQFDFPVTPTQISRHSTPAPIGVLAQSAGAPQPSLEAIGAAFVPLHSLSHRRYPAMSARSACPALPGSFVVAACCDLVWRACRIRPFDREFRMTSGKAIGGGGSLPGAGRAARAGSSGEYRCMPEMSAVLALPARSIRRARGDVGRLPAPICPF
jgi:hypothetical protein